MKTSKILVLTLALMVSIFAANFIVGCSEEKSSNPITSAVTPTDNTVKVDSSQVFYRDTVEVSAEMYQENERNALSPAAAYSASGWHAMSQTTRNQIIISKALSENRMCVPYNCKTWARHIVEAASGCVTLPSTSMPTICPKADGYAFCPSSNVRLTLQNQSVVYSALKQGQIMQMWYAGNYNPHTAFIYVSDAGGITFLDCNFVGSNMVGTHWMSWSTFYTKVKQFSVYEVL
ncbi:MAG: hypothetical protein Q8O51_02760 [bacterium]|nr:hypothetical protein [bacterium]